MRTVNDARRVTGTTIQRRLIGLVTDLPAPQQWPWRVALGSPSGGQLRDDWEHLRDIAREWRRFESPPAGIELAWVVRRIHGIRQSLPTSIAFDNLDAAAAFAGPATVTVVSAARQRWSALTDRFPSTATPTMLQAVVGWDQTAFVLALKAADWFRCHPEPDNTWTPRMIPVPGLHAKWLDPAHRRRIIAELAGIPQIGVRDRPAQAHISYLDPQWLTNGGRRYDVVTEGDPHPLPYRPRVVVITENRDTALYFPDIPEGIAVRGDGDRILRTLREPLLLSAPYVAYWGDIDTDGLEIVNGLRQRGAELTTILMDIATYDTYRQFGTDTDRRGRTFGAPERKHLLHLTAAEQNLYERLTDPDWTGPRRIEQERIPLTVAADLLFALTKA